MSSLLIAEVMHVFDNECLAMLAEILTLLLQPWQHGKDEVGVPAGFGGRGTLGGREFPPYIGDGRWVYRRFIEANCAISPFF